MSTIDGTWDTKSQTPMGEQTSKLELQTDGSGSVTGSSETMIGKIDISEGSFDGENLKLVMKIKVPMPMEITITATVAGDTMEGTMKMGPMGEFPMSGTKAA